MANQHQPTSTDLSTTHHPRDPRDFTVDLGIGAMVTWTQCVLYGLPGFGFGAVTVPWAMTRAPVDATSNEEDQWMLTTGSSPLDAIVKPGNSPVNSPIINDDE